MKNISTDDGVRTRLILGALDELCEHGVSDFSLRRVASYAQVSCAAPYRHFKSKEELIAETARYITSKWSLLAREIISAHEGDERTVVIELCVAAVKFWVANGKFRSLLLPDARSALAAEMKAFDLPVTERIDLYLESKGLDSAARAQKRMLTLSVIYGFVLLASSGKLTPAEAIKSSEMWAEEAF